MISKVLTKIKNFRYPNTNRISNQDIGVKLDIEKCAVLIVNKRKIEEIQLLNQKSRRMFPEKEICNFLGSLKADSTLETLTTLPTKNKKKKNPTKQLKTKPWYPYTQKPPRETKHTSCNLVEGICEVFLVRYPGLFLKWTRKKLRNMDQRKGKLMVLWQYWWQSDNSNRL